MTIPNSEDDADWMPTPFDIFLQSRRIDEHTPEGLNDFTLSIVLKRQWITTPTLMRKIAGFLPEAIGWNRCDRLLARMEAAGIVGPIDSEHRNRRDVLARRH